MTMPRDKKDYLTALKSLGLAGVIGYGIASLCTYTFTFATTWYGYAQTTGEDPAQNLLPVLGLVWIAARLSQPIRIGGAVFLAPVITYFLKRRHAQPS
ncbi:hypothetical protein [Candidatus Cyanaurora vandensis]|uniref:hypothetical protein n=1 Tax=Candidatus Cyanaurora vandensis TaxID=2714958 RepID=UPI00257CCC60|nr:hypothetical protein [Candidatus Cyanaurora vandensis]